MSRDELFVRDAIAAAVRRRRALLVGEAAAWAAAAAGVVWIATLPLGLAMPARVAAIAAFEAIAAAAVAAKGRRTIDRAAVTRALERAAPAARNAIVTADEIAAGMLSATPLAGARVFAAAATALHGIDVRRVFPLKALLRPAAAAAAVWAAALGLVWWRHPASILLDAVRGAASGIRAGSGDRSLHVTVTIQPPTYTGLRATTMTDPPEVRAVEGSSAVIDIDAGASRVTIEQDGARRSAPRTGGGRTVDRLTLDRTGYALVESDNGSRRLISVVVSPDLLPAVKLAAPGRDLIFGGGNPRIAFDARATDDFGLRSLTLQYTKVSGSGEQWEFHDGDVPLTIVRTTGREWRGSATTSIADLGLGEGDTLVYRAVAEDGRPGGGVASSDAFFIEVSKLGAAAGDAFTLPDQESRYALSEQMLIVKTERLHQRRGSMTADAVRDAALDLAVEQRMIRAEFVFMLGGEIEDEEVEAEQSTELQEGRLQNRGQRDLRAATVAMSQAQKMLTGADTAAALTAERAAVAALQRAFVRDRYILRALASRGELDLQRRLTGNATQAIDWRRQPPAASENRHAARLQDLLSGLSGIASPADAVELAHVALRVDAESAGLRRVAGDLQVLADRWPSTSAADRARAIDAASAVVAAEAKRALASPPFVRDRIASPLAGAFLDALASRKSQVASPTDGRR